MALHKKYSFCVYGMDSKMWEKKRKNGILVEFLTILRIKLMSSSPCGSIDSMQLYLSKHFLDTIPPMLILTTVHIRSVTTKQAYGLRSVFQYYNVSLTTLTCNTKGIPHSTTWGKQPSCSVGRTPWPLASVLSTI